MTENEILRFVKQIVRADQAAMPDSASPVFPSVVYSKPSSKILAALMATLPLPFEKGQSGSVASHLGWAAAAGEALSGVDRPLGMLPALVINGEGEETLAMADITQKPRVALQSGKLALGLRLTVPPFPAGAVYAASFLAVRAAGESQTIETGHVITVGVEANIGTRIDDPQLLREWRTIAQMPWQDLPLRIVLRKISERA